MRETDGRDDILGLGGNDTLLACQAAEIRVSSRVKYWMLGLNDR